MPLVNKIQINYVQNNKDYVTEQKLISSPIVENLVFACIFDKSNNEYLDKSGK